MPGIIIILCRFNAVIMVALSASAAILSVVSLPPVLERWILSDGQIHSGARVLLYYGLSSCFLIVAVILGWKARALWVCAPKIQARFLLLLLITITGSSLLGIITAELALRMAFLPGELLSGDAYWIARWAVKRTAETYTKGLDPEYPMNRFHPVLGWVPAENYRSEMLNTNSHGLRGRREQSFAKPKGEKRIVVIGDSFTFGEGVRDDDVYTTVLEKMLPGVRILNLGVLGYGTDQQYLRLKSLGSRYDPDLVILGFFGPNTDRNVLTFRDYAKPIFHVVDDQLQLANVPVPDPDDPAMAWTVPMPLFYSWTLMKKEMRSILDRTRFASKWVVTRKILDEIWNTTHVQSTQLLLVYMPSKHTSFSKFPDDDEIFVTSWAAEKNVPCLNLRPVFLKLSSEQRHQVWYGHWTTFGNRVVAGAIANHPQVQRLVASGAR